MRNYPRNDSKAYLASKNEMQGQSNTSRQQKSQKLQVENTIAQKYRTLIEGDSFRAAREPNLLFLLHSHYPFVIEP